MAESLKPRLGVQVDKPLGIVVAEQDSSAIMGWSATRVSESSSSDVLKPKEQVVFDFGKYQ
jgi:hypothetical protein